MFAAAVIQRQIEHSGVNQVGHDFGFDLAEVTKGEMMMHQIVENIFQ